FVRPRFLNRFHRTLQYPNCNAVLPRFVSLAPRSEAAGELASSFATSKNPLLHICDFDDAALCLWVLWILDHGDEQFFLAFAECDVGCSVTGGDLKYVEQLAVGR